MESRFNMFDNEIGARFSKRFASASLVYFTVARDGTVDYDPALEGALTGRRERRRPPVAPGQAVVQALARTDHRVGHAGIAICLAIA
jgi:hypothetical protein